MAHTPPRNPHLAVSCPASNCRSPSARRPVSSSNPPVSLAWLRSSGFSQDPEAAQPRRPKTNLWGGGADGTKALSVQTAGLVAPAWLPRPRSPSGAASGADGTQAAHPCPAHIMMCLRRCRARWSEREKLRSQSEQRKGLMPVCLRKCLVSSSERANFQVQPSQVHL